MAEVVTINAQGIPSTPNATVIPACNPSGSNEEQETIQAIKQAIDGFSDEVPVQENEEKVQESKNFLNWFRNYIGSQNFKDSVNNASIKYNVPPKAVAKNFFENILGTIGDVLGVAIGTVRNVGHTIVDIITAVLHGGVNLICNIANALASIVTLNKTNTATA